MPRWREALVAPVAGALAYGAIDLIDSGTSLLGAAPEGSREALFAALAGATGALLGFAIAGVTILLTVGQRGPRMSWLAQQDIYKQEARFLFLSAIMVLGFATVVFLALIIAGTDKEGIRLVWGALAGAAIVGVVDRMASLIRFLDQLMRITMDDDDGGQLPNPPFMEPMDD